MLTVAALATNGQPSSLVCPSRREATLTLSPTTVKSSAPGGPMRTSIRSPVWMPTPVANSGNTPKSKCCLNHSPNLFAASTIPRPARMARQA